MTDTIPSRLLARAAERPDAPAFHTRDPAGGWAATSWRAYADETRAAARALIALGLAPGERVCVIGFNRPEWVVFDVAAMMAGGVPAGIYTTCSPSEVAWIVRHSESRIVLVEDEDQWNKLAEERSQLPQLEHVVLMRGARVDDPMALRWEAFLARAAEVPEATLDARLAAIRPEDPATFIYTSGTTGPPKAVVLTHHNLTFTADTASTLIDMGTEDRMVSYLPLSHIAEQLFTIHGQLTIGYRIYFARSLEQVLDDFLAARPTVLFAVPRVWEKMHARLTAGLADAPPLRRRVAAWAMGVGQRVVALRNQGREPSGLLAVQYRLADRLVFGKVKARLGLDAGRFGITGAAPIAPEILQFFAGLDIVIHEVYGQSEDTGPTTFNRPGATRYGTVGQAIPGTEVRIAEDGEILVRGPHVFAGYFKDEAATTETLTDGWLRSGDLGAFDDDGFLTITGRKKEILITAGGKNIAPKNIEAALKHLPLVSQAVVIGDRRRFLSALVTLDPDAAAAFCRERGLPTDAPHRLPEVIAEVQRGVDEVVNPQFARVEHVRKFTILHRDLTVDDGELTPTLKIKRRVVDEHFAAEIEAMYA